MKIGSGQSEGTSKLEVQYVLRLLLNYNAIYGAAFSGAIFSPLFAMPLWCSRCRNKRKEWTKEFVKVPLTNSASLYLKTLLKPLQPHTRTEQRSCCGVFMPLCDHEETHTFTSDFPLLLKLRHPWPCPSLSPDLYSKHWRYHTPPFACCASRKGECWRTWGDEQDLEY